MRWDLVPVLKVRSPMAMAVIGGLMTSTLLTLVVIPVIFTYVDGFLIWIFKLGRGKGRREEGAIEYIWVGKRQCRVPTDIMVPGRETAGRRLLPIRRRQCRVPTANLLR